MEDYQLEILRAYKHALIYIGVDFTREDVLEALEHCIDGMEDAFRATISYWKWKGEKLEYPSACLINALSDQWQPFEWQDSWLMDERFKSPCQTWWEEAEIYWGKDVRNSLIADVVDKFNGSDYIMLVNEKTITLARARSMGWEKLLDYVQILMEM